MYVISSADFEFHIQDCGRGDVKVENKGIVFLYIRMVHLPEKLRETPEIFKVSYEFLKGVIFARIKFSWDLKILATMVAKSTKFNPHKNLRMKNYQKNSNNSPIST